jgi:isopropylmalate/homocitrate/citramalate synthase
MSSTPWIGDKWFVSPFNFAPEVLSSMNLPKKVEIYDVTLRDGEQCPGVVFRSDEKVRIAQLLDEVGVHRIEAGMPVVSEDDFKAVKQIAQLGLKAKVKAFCRARRDDIDTSLRADVWGVLIELPSSKTLIERGYRWDEKRVLDMAVDAAQYAKAHGLHTTFFCVDSTRANPEYLKALITKVVNEAKVDAIAIVDTFGVTAPWGFAHLIRQIKSWVDVPIEVHCHNDMNLAVANSVSAVTAGAEVIHTNVNGIGERSGGAALEEVAVILRILLNMDIGLRLENLRKLSKYVEEASGVKMPPIKPVVGDQSFAYEAGIAVMFSVRFRDEGYLQGALPYLPELVGNEFKIILGKKSGGHSIAAKLRELGIQASEEQINSILTQVKNLSIQKKGPVTDEEFKEIVQKTLKT